MRPQGAEAKIDIHIVSKGVMRKKCLTLICLVPLFVFAQKEKQNLLVWKNNRKLTWKDFQGAEPAKHVKDAAAETTTTIHCTYSFTADTLKYLVYSTFDKTESWTKIFNDYSLKHEQDHFDISEIVTRRLREYFQNAAVSTAKNSKDSFKMQVQKIIDSEPILQEEYDDQTVFGRDSLQQHKWNRYIAKTLDSLKCYTQLSGKRLMNFLPRRVCR